jgi:replicative DNA helicase Mcm
MEENSNTDEIFDSKDLIKRFHLFFEEYMSNEIRKIINQGEEALIVSFFDITQYDPELSETILLKPEDSILLMEQTLKQFYEDSQVKKNIKVRFKNLPLTEKIMIRDIRAEHLGKLLVLEGQIRRKTDVRPRLKFIEYLCTNPTCSYSETKLKIPQNEEKTRTLKACPKCKSAIELVGKNLVDSQNLLLEEIPEQLNNTSDQPKRINVMLQEDLVTPFKDSKTNPGSKVYVIGIVKEIPIKTRTGADSTNFELLIEGNYIGLIEDDYADLKISKEEREKIETLAKKDDIIDILVANTAPSIYGYSKIKEAILLQLFGGAGGIKGDGIKTRGDIHILLIGDPGAAKSQLLKSASKVAPKSMFVSGKSATGVGLTATVVRDDLTRGWALEAGAMVLASGGLCAIDELDKMSEDDTSAMHEALEQQTVSIAKANIRATLKCETTVLGAANPKMGRFDQYGDIHKQINFPPALISRFDLIFVLRDIPDKKKDDLIANHILRTHKDKELSNTKISKDFMKKYISYSKSIRPILTDKAIEKIKEFYISIRNASNDEEDGQKPVPVTARQLEALIRLSEAYARMKLDRQIKEEYAQKAIDLLLYCLQKIGIDPKTGKMDIDRITTGVTTTSRNQYKTISDIIDNLNIDKGEILLDDIIEEAGKYKIKPGEVQRILEKLRQEGIIFEPRRNTFKKLF